MSKISGVANGIRAVIGKRSPEILMGVGIAGMITTTVLAVKATPKALKLVDVERCRRVDADDPDGYKPSLTPIETVQVTWRCYIPAAVVGCASILCLIGASSANARRNAALATAYALSESTLRDYKDKVVETIGDKKEQSVRDAIAKDKIDRDPVANREIIITEKGNTLCYDVISGRYFKSDIEKLRKTENELNRQMRDRMYIPLNDFYYEIGLQGTKLGDDLGWSIDGGYIDLRFSSQLSDDETPCLVIDYQIAPKYDYSYSR